MLNLSDKKVLITGFEEYNNYSVNPAKMIAKSFDGVTIDGALCKGRVMPGTYDSFSTIKSFVEIFDPDLIINVGLATRNKALRLETTAHNIMNHEYKDNNGVLMSGEKISENGPESYYIESNSQSLCTALFCGLEKTAVEVSDNANAYLCNDLMYRTAQYIAENNLDTGHIYIHTPRTDLCQHTATDPNIHEKHIISHTELEEAIKIMVREYFKSQKQPPQSH